VKDFACKIREQRIESPVMRFLKTYDFKGIKGFELGWSPAGAPLMTAFCFVLHDLMVDTGLSHMQREVLKISEDHKVKRIFLTHYHEDHSGNARAIRQKLGIKVYGHPMTVEKMARPFRILPYQKLVWGKAAPLDMDPFPDKIDTALGTMVPVYTPGHSKDHTSFFIEDAGILFSGDLYLADRIKYFREDECLGTEIESLKKVLKLEFEVLLCSHFPKMENGRKRIKAKLAFFEDLYGSIIELWKKGIPEKEIFRVLNLKEDHFTRLFCFGNVSMMNGVRSAVRHYENRQ
jgi:glyoxylase-like metal-dependent hydrolase (beta-lactamase superfamily II)